MSHCRCKYIISAPIYFQEVQNLLDNHVSLSGADLYRAGGCATTRRPRTELSLYIYIYMCVCVCMCVCRRNIVHIIKWHPNEQNNHWVTVVKARKYLSASGSSRPGKHIKFLELLLVRTIGQLMLGVR